MRCVGYTTPHANTHAVERYRPIPVNKYGGLAAKDRQQQRRERLIAAGFKLFATIGFANTSIQTLAETANCALRTFYEEFGTREALLLEMYDRTITQVLRETLDALNAAGSEGVSLIRTGVDAYVRAMTRDPQQTRIALIEVVDVNREIDKRRRDAIHAFVRGLGTAIAPARRAAGATGDDEDLDVVILALAGASDVLVTEWLLSKGRLTTERDVKGGAPIADPSVVMVPQRLYPSGYSVAVSGATVTSQTNANALTLATDTGATSITVTVSPSASSTSSKRTRHTRLR